MRTIENMLQAVENLDLQYEIENALYESGPIFLDQQREQIFSGRRNDDQLIYNLNTGLPEYSEEYEPIKGRSSPIDLYVTGAFYQGFIFDVRDKTIYLDSTDEKTEKLVDWYSENIFGLSPKSRQVFVPKLATIFNDNVTLKLNR